MADLDNIGFEPTVIHLLLPPEAQGIFESISFL